MNKKYLIIGILIALAILIAFLLWPDRQHDSHAGQHADIVADHDTLRSRRAVYDKVVDSLANANHRLDSANKSLVKGQDNTQRRLDVKTAEVRTLVAQIREINSDTGFFGHLLDSLEQQVSSLQFLIVQYEQYADSINNVNDSIKITSGATVKEKDKRIAELQASYDKLYKEYISLFETTKGLQKDLRRQRLKTKVASVLGAGAAVIMLLK